MSGGKPANGQRPSGRAATGPRVAPRASKAAPNTTGGADIARRKIIAGALIGAGAMMSPAGTVVVARRAEAVVVRAQAAKAVWEVLKALATMETLLAFIERVRRLIRLLSGREEQRARSERGEAEEEALEGLYRLRDQVEVRQEITIILRRMTDDEGRLTTLSVRMEKLEAGYGQGAMTETLFEYEATLAAFESRARRIGAGSLAGNMPSTGDGVRPLPVPDPSEPLACTLRAFASLCER